MLDKKTVIVAGCLGYIGNALVQRLLSENYHVIGIDDNSREINVQRKMNSFSATSQNMLEKVSGYKELGDFSFHLRDISNHDYSFLKNLIIDNCPATFVNLAHQPSGPFSMMSNAQANYSLYNNIIGTNNILWAIKETFPEIHYTTIGSTGEYDHYCNIDIEEGYWRVNHKGRESNEMIFPRRPTSIYHTSKVGAFSLAEYLTRMWGLTTTEAEQSIVFGLYTKETDETKIYSRLDTDGSFGTVLNKFIVQALLGIPLTIFGEGLHQRGFIALQDSVNAIMLSIENPPIPGKLRTFNQLSETHSILDLVKKVEMQAKIQKNIDVVRNHIIPSPRKEFTGDHYYNFVSEILPSLGYKPSRTIEQEIEYIFKTLEMDYIENLRESIQKNVKF